VFTNDNQRTFMMNYPPAAGGSYPTALTNRVDRLGITSLHPVPPANWYTLGQAAVLDQKAASGSSTRRLRLGYFGHFYATRGPGDILQAFKQLDPAERQAVCLELRCPNPDEVQAVVEQYGLTDCVRVGPLLPYLDFLATAQQMDWLIVADFHTIGSHHLNPYRPCKVADYYGAGARIWGLLEPGSALGREPLDLVSPLGDAQAATAALRQIVAQQPS
ncbi:MAG: hypothetical protein LBG70_04755, partial [Bifidobacteriaceae bacterium]|nr:hypothetical protein [Bifidobacteriaceae bacterium]